MLTILHEVEGSDKNRAFKCRCECGNTTTVKLYLLRRGETKSCGCKKRNHLIDMNTSHGMSRSKLSAVWQAMKQRCLNSENQNFPYYGGRGIGICDDWIQPEAFFKWAQENGYREGLSLERINVDGNYEPSNCKWVTMKVQNRNKRDNNVIEFRGERLCMQDWANRLGIERCTLDKRLKNWSLEKALTTPKIEQCS